MVLWSFPPVMEMLYWRNAFQYAGHYGIQKDPRVKSSLVSEAEGLARATFYQSDNQWFEFFFVLIWSQNEGGQYAGVLNPLKNRRG